MTQWQREKVFSIQQAYIEATKPWIGILIEIENCAFVTHYVGKEFHEVRRMYSPEAFLLKHQINQELTQLRNQAIKQVREFV